LTGINTTATLWWLWSDVMSISPEPETSVDDTGQDPPQKGRGATKAKTSKRPVDAYLNKWGLDTRSVIAHPSFWILIAILLSISLITKLFTH
jgi:hypothetical protein